MFVSIGTPLAHAPSPGAQPTLLDGASYYNNISGLQEVFRLRHNAALKELDLRLNPVTKEEPDYRLFIVHMLVHLRTLGEGRGGKGRGGFTNMRWGWGGLADMSWGWCMCVCVC